MQAPETHREVFRTCLQLPDEVVVHQARGAFRPVGNPMGGEPLTCVENTNLQVTMFFVVAPITTKIGLFQVTMDW